MDKVTIIILNWNSTNDTLNCIDSLKTNYDIIVIDNGSNSNELELLKAKLQKNVHLILNDKNYGFAFGNNQGIRYAIEHFHPDYVLLLNSDTIVTPNFLEPLISLMHTAPKISAVQPKILKMKHVRDDGSDIQIIDSAGQVAYSYGNVRDIGISRPDGQVFQKRKEVFGACGAAVLYRTSAIQDAGLFDERLFSLFEDVDLSWRLRLKGCKIFFEPDSIVYHKRGVSGKIRKANKIIRRFYGFRNCLIVTARYYPMCYIIKFLPLHIYKFVTALYFKFRYTIKAPLFKLILSSIKERKNIQKSPLIKEIQNNWIK